jgi:hypothetical protein
VIFALAEILGLEQLGQADDLSATASSVRNAADGLLKILLGLGAA